MERTSRFLTILALPARDADSLAEVLVRNANALPAMMRKSLTSRTRAPRWPAQPPWAWPPDMPVYSAHPRSPWERGTNENTNGLIPAFPPGGAEITIHQPYLTAIRPRDSTTSPEHHSGSTHPKKSSNTCSLPPPLDTAPPPKFPEAKELFGGRYFY